jgi:putative endonuclease
MTMARRAEPLAPKRAPRPERVAAFGLGLSAESRAAAYLVAKGYRILARRWKSPAGELDIVARRRHLLVFVEVKARASLDAAAEAVLPRQQQRIAAAAEAWLATYPNPKITDMRFDAILVAPRKLPRHIEGAFETT